MKCLTLPKLDLHAVLQASGLRQEVQCSISLEKERYFIRPDSVNVLQWLHLLEKQPVIVVNRVTETLEPTLVDERNCVPTGDNTAEFDRNESTQHQQDQNFENEKTSEIVCFLLGLKAVGKHVQPISERVVHQI